MKVIEREDSNQSAADNSGGLDIVWAGRDHFSSIAFGSLTILSDNQDSRLCVPASQQVCLYRCNPKLKRSTAIRGQTQLNKMANGCQYIILIKIGLKTSIYGRNALRMRSNRAAVHPILVASV